MKIILDDVSVKHDLYPFTEIRSVIDIRIGILTIREKWILSGESIQLLSESAQSDSENETIKIPANFIPSDNWIAQLKKTSTFEDNGINPVILEHPWQIFENNDRAIREDFELLTKGKRSRPLSS